jgi:hydroxymethylpyrimidine/phosphomethylpyrimidine kinase
MFYITALTIAGSDCSGGAGIQADIKTMSALGVYASSVITAITVQNTKGVKQVYPIDSAVITDQINAVMDDIRPQAVKIGMMDRGETVSAIADTLRKYRDKYIVVDPVMISSSGTRLMRQDAVGTFCSKLLPMTYLLTPNTLEAEQLSGIEINSMEDARAAACRIAKTGCRNVLITGGHIEGDTKNDWLFMFDGERVVWEYVFSDVTVPSTNNHGTGCTFSSAITALLARGLQLPEAVSGAKHYITEALKAGKDVHIGDGHGPLNHFFAPLPLILKEQIDE